MKRMLNEIFQLIHRGAAHGIDGSMANGTGRKIRKEKGILIIIGQAKTMQGHVTSWKEEGLEVEIGSGGGNGGWSEVG